MSRFRLVVVNKCYSYNIHFKKFMKDNDIDNLTMYFVLSFKKLQGRTPQ